MTTSFETTNLTEISKTDKSSSDSTNPKILLTLKVIEYLFLAALVYAVVITQNFPEIQIAKTYVAAFLAVWIFFFFTNRQLSESYRRTAIQADLNKKAELHILGKNNPLANSMITPAREKALQYCQELIDDYKRTRRDSRNVYYISQIATIVLSGITPILVLVDKLETGLPWLKWLPVICPALASIVASIVTSFPLQENWISANTCVELLEAEQEKFILGVTQLYRYDDSGDEIQNQQKAIENFINQVNSVHLKQLQDSSEAKLGQEKTQSNQSVESNKPT